MMRRIKLYLRIFIFSTPVFVFSFLISSCEEEIDLIMESPSTPVIYCLINPFDTVHYVRVTKTYIPDNVNNNIPLSDDSLYFSGEVEVSLERWNENRAIETIKFQKTTEISKDHGLFPNQNNILFIANHSITPGDRYILYVYIKDRGLIIDAETVMVGELDVIDPLPFVNREITLLENQDYKVRWNLASAAWIYQVVSRFNYFEITDGDTIQKNFEWVLNASYPGEHLENFIYTNINGSRFYQEILKNIKENPEVTRKVKDMDIVIYYGGMELRNYVESLNPSRSVLQEKPKYSSFKYCEGVFSSLSKNENKGIGLSKIFIDSIADGKKTKNLNFLDSDNIY
ncbi:hypothetical protein ACFLSY_01305 [Bacteroidota bacterium]